MAQFKSTTFGKISGKHGNAVAAVRKDGTHQKCAGKRRYDYNKWCGTVPETPGAFCK